MGYEPLLKASRNGWVLKTQKPISVPIAKQPYKRIKILLKFTIVLVKCGIKNLIIILIHYTYHY